MATTISAQTGKTKTLMDLFFCKSMHKNGMGQGVCELPIVFST